LIRKNLGNALGEKHPGPAANEKKKKTGREGGGHGTVGGPEQQRIKCGKQPRQENRMEKKLKARQEKGTGGKVRKGARIGKNGVSKRQPQKKKKKGKGIKKSQLGQEGGEPVVGGKKRGVNFSAICTTPSRSKAKKLLVLRVNKEGGGRTSKRRTRTPGT